MPVAEAAATAASTDRQRPLDLIAAIDIHAAPHSLAIASTIEANGRRHRRRCSRMPGALPAITHSSRCTPYKRVSQAHKASRLNNREPPCHVRYPIARRAFAWVSCPLAG